MSNNPPKALFFVLLIISGSVFTFQIVLSAILGFLYYNDFRFLAIVFSYLGFGLGGLFSSILRRNRDQITIGTIFWGSLILIVTGTLPFALIRGIATEYGSLLSNAPQILLFYLLIAISFVHFFVAGYTISGFYAFLNKQTFRLYFFDLLGAGLFSLITLLVLDRFGIFWGIRIIFVTNALGLMGISYVSRRNLSTGKILSGIAVIIAGSALLLFTKFNFTCTPGLVTVREKSNSFSLVQLIKPTYQEHFVKFSIVYNCYQMTDGYIARNIESLRKDLDDIRNIPYALVTNPRNILILGSGGGVDIHRALLVGAQHVQAVEINPLIVDAVNSFSQYFGKSAYQEKGVSVSLTDARSFVTKTKDKYDLIIIAYNKGNFGKPLGSLIFPQQMFTIESFREYLRVLRPDGFLAIYDSPIFNVVYLKTLTALIENSGGKSNERIITGTTGDSIEGKSLIIYKNGIITDNDKRKFQILLTHYGNAYKIHSLPYGDGTDAQVLTDDSPYILRRGDGDIKEPTMRFLMQLRNYIILAFVVLAASITTFVIHFQKKVMNLGISMYSFGTSLGLATLEFVFIQKGSQLIGNPTYVHSLTLASVLIGAALGSLLLSNFASKNIGKINLIMVCLMGVAFCGFNLFTNIIQGFPGELKILIFMMTILSLSFISGTFFPYIIRFVGKNNHLIISWIWGIDAVAFIACSLLLQYAVFSVGINASLIFGIVGYLISFLSLKFILSN